MGINVQDGICVSRQSIVFTDDGKTQELIHKMDSVAFAIKHDVICNDQGDEDSDNDNVDDDEDKYGSIEAPR